MPIDITDQTHDASGALWAEPVVAIAEFALDRLRIHPESELSIAFVDDSEMERLHLEWMDLPGATDVLSFPMDELRPTPDDAEPVPGVLGDIVLAPSFVARQAADHEVTPLAEAELLTVHGVLHLLGFDHADPDEEREMFTLQNAIVENYRATAQAGTR
jgi:probable rRNA maturation factor